MPIASRTSGTAHRARFAAVSVAVAAAFVFGRQHPCGAQEPASAPSSRPVALLASAHAAIDSANAAWLGAMKRMDAAAVAEPYADSAVFVTPWGTSARGRSAIEQLMRQRFAASGPMIDGTIRQDGVTVQGSLIYEWGHATTSFSRGGRTVSGTGRYLTVWARDPASAGTGGRWRIIRNLSLPN